MTIHFFVELPDVVWESATTAEDLVDAADESLFRTVLCSKHHVLDELLPPKSDVHHNLMKQRHHRTLPDIARKDTSLLKKTLLLDC